MSASTKFEDLEVGYDIPARPGMDEADIQTPCLVLDLDALERNIRKMGDYAAAHGMGLRVHGKMHKSADIAKLQQRIGGAVGICCQKPSEAEAFVRGGIADVLVSNEVRDLKKIDRLAQIPKRGARVLVCVDDPVNVAELSEAASRHGTQLEVLVEIDCGQGRCGVTTPEEVVGLARAIEAADGLKYSGIQAYQGTMQHIESYSARVDAFERVSAQVRGIVAGLEAAGLTPELVSGGGTGSYSLESNSGIYNELQCGSYAFMDADYGRIENADGERFDDGEWENAFFLLTQVMSHVKADRAVVDAGLKSQSLDSGLPFVHSRDDVEYISCSDEHGVVSDPTGVLKVGDKLRLVPGHCDPTVNLHDWFVGVRNGKVETLWPVTARGKAY